MRVGTFRILLDVTANKFWSYKSLSNRNHRCYWAKIPVWQFSSINGSARLPSRVSIYSGLVLFLVGDFNLILFYQIQWYVRLYDPRVYSSRWRYQPRIHHTAASNKSSRRAGLAVKTPMATSGTSSALLSLFIVCVSVRIDVNTNNSWCSGCRNIIKRKTCSTGMGS